MHAEGLPVCYLKSGEYCLVKSPTLIKTVLGSCLAVTMWSPRTGVGAACHALLASCWDRGSHCQIGHSCPTSGACLGSVHHCNAGKCRDKFRFVECVIPAMLRQLQDLGHTAGELEVKLFGGADLMMGELPEEHRVGRVNAKTARALLGKLDIVVRSEDVGGDVGRKLVFDTSNGAVWIKMLGKGVTG